MAQYFPHEYVSIKMTTVVEYTKYRDTEQGNMINV